MKTNTIFSLILMALATVAVSHADRSAGGERRIALPAADELKNFQGAWALKSYVVNGKQTRGEDPRSTFRFEGATWSSTWRLDASGSQVESGAVKVIAANASLVIDLIHEAGKYKGTTTRALMQITDGDLHVVQVIFPGTADAKELTTIHAKYCRQPEQSATPTADAKAIAPTPATASLTNWKIARAFEFNGVDDFVSVPDHPALHFSTLTLSAWVRTDDADKIQPIVGKTVGKGNQMSYLLRIQDGGRLSLALGNTGDAVCGRDTLWREAHWRTKASLTRGKWHHVAATWHNERGDKSDAILYIDGVAQESEMTLATNYGRDFRPGYSAEPLLIGRDQFPSGYFKGAIEDLDVTGSVLSAESIRKQMAKRAARQCDLKTLQAADSRP